MEFLKEFSWLEAYKTLKCQNLTCNNKLFNDLLPECKYYHSAKDKRRKIIIQKNQFNYSPYFFFETVQTEHCQNQIEYLYHPLNFKQNLCPYLKQSQENCGREFCPYYHSLQDQQKMIILKQQLFAKVSYKSLFFQSIEIYKNISQKPKKAQASKDFTNFFEDPQALANDAQLDELFDEQELSTQKHESFKILEEKNTIYYLYDQVKIYEDQYNEFKEYSNLGYYQLLAIEKYICAFLNLNGGKLFIGISDNGVVKGMQLQRKQRDQFSCQLDAILKHFHPPVLSELCQLVFSPIYLKKPKNINQATKPKQLADKYIIEIIIAKTEQDELYFTSLNDCFVKRIGSIEQILPHQIQKYLLEKIKKKENKQINKTKAD